MGEVIELKPKGEPKDSDEATTWSVEEALKTCLEDIQGQKIAMPSHLYIAMLIPDEDGGHKMAYMQAGMKNCFETIGVLEIHSSYHSGLWSEIE